MVRKHSQTNRSPEDGYNKYHIIIEFANLAIPWISLWSKAENHKIMAPNIQTHQLKGKDLLSVQKITTLFFEIRSMILKLWLFNCNTPLRLINGSGAAITT